MGHKTLVLRRSRSDRRLQLNEVLDAGRHDRHDRRNEGRRDGHIGFLYFFHNSLTVAYFTPIITGLGSGDWRLPLNQDDVQDVEEPVEDPGIQEPEGEVVDNVEQ